MLPIPIGRDFRDNDSVFYKYNIDVPRCFLSFAEKRNLFYSSRSEWYRHGLTGFILFVQSAFAVTFKAPVAFIAFISKTKVKILIFFNFGHLNV